MESASPVLRYGSPDGYGGGSGEGGDITIIGRSAVVVESDVGCGDRGGDKPVTVTYLFDHRGVCDRGGRKPVTATCLIIVVLAVVVLLVVVVVLVVVVLIQATVSP